MTPRWLTHPARLWLAFIAAHVWLIWLGMMVVPGALGDLFGVYRFWVDTALGGGPLVGITTPWVYPPLALVPMFVPAIVGSNGYVLAWLVMVTIGDLIAFFYLIRGFTRPAPRALAAWWWTGALVALGPVALGRLDSVVTPLAIWALLFVLTRPRLAGVLMAFGAWIKVWPGAILIAAILVAQRRWRILVAFVVTSAVVLGAALAAGAGTNALSFIGYQNSRGLQIESPSATWFMWLAGSGTGSAQVYFDNDMLTYQVTGPGSTLVASTMTWLMVVAVLATVALTALGARRDVAPVRLLPAATLALVMALIAFNKVGSPQYFVWLVPPIVAGLIIDRRRFSPIAAVALVATLLTQVIYPWIYVDIIEVRVGGLLLLTVRNALELVLFAWALVLVVRPRSRADVRAGIQRRHSR